MSRRKSLSGTDYKMARERHRGLLAAAALIGVSGLAAGVGLSQDKSQSDGNKDKGISVTVQSPDNDAGLVVSGRASAKEVGLPVYPGSIPYKDPDEKHDSPAANLGLWGDSFGFKLVVLKMESRDKPTKVAEYYQKALGKYGAVLDCTNPAKNDKDENSKKLTCGDDKPEAGGMLFKAGTKERQHIVGVQPKGNGTVFQLLFIEARGAREPA